jgi:hypothetical protein
MDSPAGKLNDDIDALFKLPLSEFTSARNDLAARLKRDGQADDANLVKAISKPSVSAWAVNQLYWKHRDAFDRLLATSQCFRKAQAAGEKMTAIRESLDARGEALSRLSDLATVLLRDAGHNPAPDTIHRITTTLEALSSYAKPSDGSTLGRLTQDVDPPGFESLASLMSGILDSDAKRPGSVAKKLAHTKEPDVDKTKTRQRPSRDVDVQQAQRGDEDRTSRIAAAKASLQQSRKSLTEAQARAQRLEAARKKAQAEAKKAAVEATNAEKQLRQAEQRFKKANGASQEATDRALGIAAEADEAGLALEDARRSFDNKFKALESLLRK